MVTITVSVQKVLREEREECVKKWNRVNVRSCLLNQLLELSEATMLMSRFLLLFLNILRFRNFSISEMRKSNSLK